MEIRHEDGAFTTGEGEGRAELTYRLRPTGDLMVVDHTFVPPAGRGRGVAEALVEAAAAHARGAGLRIVPACPYVARLFERHPERYRDVAADGA